MSGHRQLHAAWRGDTGALVRFPVLTFSHLFSFSFGRCTIVRLTSCDASPHQKFHHPLSSRFCRCSGNPSRRSCSADRRLRCVPRTDTRCRVPQRPRSRRSPTASGSVRGRSWSVFCACVASRCRQYDLRACSSIYPRRRRRELMVARIPGVCGVCAPPRLQVDFPGVRVSAVHPSSLNTAIFAKAGDRRDVSHKPGPDVAAGCFHFMLQLPSTVEVHDIVLMNRASMPRFSPTPPPVSA